MKAILLSLLLISSNQAFSKNKQFEKLSSLYKTNRELCLEKAKKYIDRKSENDIPHYFASIIYYDKSKESPTLRGIYLQMNRSLISAQKFEKYATEESKDLVHWEEHSASLKTRTIVLIDKLNADNQTDLSETLIANLQKIQSIDYIPTENNNQQIAIDSKPEIKIDFIKVEGQFYGLPTGKEVVTSSDPTGEIEILRLINSERTKKGLPILTWNENLAKAARYHAYDLATQQYFDHKTCDRINGEIVETASTFDRINQFYKGSHVNTENIAAGGSSASATFKQWFMSQQHYENMMNSSSSYIGVGVYYDAASPYGYYWVMCTAE